jgi:tellurite resistance protein TerC
MKDALASIITRFRISSLPQLRKIVVAIVGMSVLIVGVALLVLPGPAFIVIPLGLGILATEFVWARRLLKRAKQFFTKSKEPASQPEAPVEK